MIRLAAVGDLHLGHEDRGRLAPLLAGIEERADLFLLAGDLTRLGTVEEVEVLLEELHDVPVPVVAVLGNHDYHSDREEELTDRMRMAGIRVLEGEGCEFDVRGGRVGVAGVKGFGGGFPPAPLSAFGEPETKAFAEHGRRSAASLEAALSSLDTPVKVALTHYAPVRDTVEGERPEIHPFLGTVALAEAIDHGGADLAIHGHAHHGSPKGTTPGGVEVRNVAQPLLERAYVIFELPDPGGTSDIHR